MVYDFKNLGQPKNTDSGLGEFLLVAPKEWFETISVPTAPFSSPGDSVTVKTAHIFKTPTNDNVRASAGAVTLAAQVITAIAVVVGGSGYTTAPAVTISGGGGTGATAIAQVTNGVVTGVIVTNGGTGYASAPTVTFAVPPTKAYGFAKFQLVPQKNKLSAKTVGDLGLNKMNQELDFFVGGSYALLHEQMKALLNTPCIILVKDANCDAGMYYQLGCDCQAAWVTSDFDTATTKDGAKGYSAKAMYDGPVQLYIVGADPVLVG